MQTGNADRSGEFENNRYKEAGNLISICTPPCMGKTIAAVFLCLSAVSVKGFLAWLLLSALLLQLPEPVSDALSFGRSEPFFFGGSAAFLSFALPLGKVTVVLVNYGLRFAVGRHECLHIGITILPESYWTREITLMKIRCVWEHNGNDSTARHVYREAERCGKEP